MKNICVVIPTKNEEATIKEVMTSVKEKVSQSGFNIAAIIITDDSRDRTRKIAKEEGGIVVNGGGKGLGQAMFKGLKKALSFNPDIILSLDGDGQTEVGEFERFVKPIVEDRADLVLGSRFSEKNSIHYQYRLKNRMGILILVRILRALTGLKLTDSHGGLRAMRPEVVAELDIIGTHTYVQETIIDAAQKGFRVMEIPSVWKVRKEGGSRVVSNIPIYIFYTLPVLVMRSGHHIKTFFSLGIFFLILSVLDFLIVGYQTGFNLKEMFDRQSFHLIGLLLLLGFQFISFGFIMEILAYIKHQIDRKSFEPDQKP